MAISLKQINNKSKKGMKSILDVIIERKEDKLSGKKQKKKVLRPWQLHHDGLIQYSDKIKKSSIMAPFEKSSTNLSEDELMGIKIKERAKELFRNISDFL
ncbi:hypothetical protein [Halobacteriovorax sp. HLS]|uniref:hypothetical protein n=1 Tax=Halobacteriovorax sp. HLS TaxID=2234000 RepID=UPI000FDCA4AE|nr:hypothetical protein [Halobacteriovorax sp. HLS]